MFMIDELRVMCDGVQGYALVQNPGLAAVRLALAPSLF